MTRSARRRARTENTRGGPDPGCNKPSQANQAAFDRAVDDVTAAARELIASLSTSAPPRDREVEADKARERSRQRFARP